MMKQIKKENETHKTSRKRCLVTGGYGFAASYLIKLLLEKGMEVDIIVRRNSDNFRHKKLGIVGHRNLSIYYGDMTDTDFVRSVIIDTQPSIIYNLAAIMYVQDSWDIPQMTFETNTLVVLNILMTMTNLTVRCRLVQAGTSEEYGEVLESEVPIFETNKLRPKSPYAVSKVAAEHLCKIFAKEYNLDIVVTRAFNHVGRMQMKELVIPAFARRVVRAYEFGDDIEHGNLDAIRDFTSIEDIVEAYRLVGTIDFDDDSNYRVFNICSGVKNSMTMGKILDIMIEYVRFKYDVKYIPVLHQSYYRPNDVKLLVGNCIKLRSLTGWNPEKKLSNIIVDMLEEAFEEYES